MLLFLGYSKYIYFAAKIKSLIELGNFLCEIDLSFGCDKGLVRCASTVPDIVHALDGFKQTELILIGVLLVRHIVAVKVLLFAEPCEESIAADANLVVAQILRELTNLDAVGSCCDGVMEVYAFLLNTNDFILTLNRFQRCDKQLFRFLIRVRKPLIHKNDRVIDIAASCTNCWQQLIENPFLEHFCVGFMGTANQTIYIALRDKLHDSWNAIAVNMARCDAILTAMQVELTGYVCVSQCRADIVGAEIKFIIVLEDAQLAENF